MSRLEYENRPVGDQERRARRAGVIDQEVLKASVAEKTHREREVLPQTSRKVLRELPHIAVNHVRQSTDITAELPQPNSRTIAEIIEDIWSNRDRDYNVRCLVKRVQRIEKEMSGQARDWRS